MKVAFDCDGTLVNYEGKLRDEVCRLLIAFLSSGFKVIVWSGGGESYARSVWSRVIQEYHIADGMSDLLENVECKSKDRSKPELVFDDEVVNLGHFNVCWRPKYEE